VRLPRLVITGSRARCELGSRLVAGRVEARLRRRDLAGGVQERREVLLPGAGLVAVVSLTEMNREDHGGHGGSYLVGGASTVCPTSEHQLLVAGRASAAEEPSVSFVSSLLVLCDRYKSKPACY